ncbi:unnamed protein product [Toxocara canis]|uniref:Serpentine receptor class gamma n=1 Tax=Toxocara canis TaxID=6265 RepID=A0A183V8W4_TOXCA|nr:unnamed protein product [Toxocara canis]
MFQLFPLFHVVVDHYTINMGSMPLFDWIAVAFGLLSSTFYIFVILTIASQRRKPLYRSFFFKLFVMQGSMDIIFYLSMTVFIRFRKYRVLPSLDAFLREHSTGFVPAFIISFLGFIRLGLCFNILMFAANRFCAFFMQRHYETMWKDWHLSLIFLVQLSLLLPELFINFTCGSYVYAVVGPDLAVFVPTEDLQRLLALFNVLTAGVTVLIASSLYLSICFYLRLRLRSTLSHKNTVIELRILLTCLYQFAVLVLLATLDCYAYMTTRYNQHDFLSFYGDVWSVLTDLMCLVPPFALIGTCSTVRQSIFRRKKKMTAWIKTFSTMKK